MNPPQLGTYDYIAVSLIRPSATKKARRVAPAKQASDKLAADERRAIEQRLKEQWAASRSKSSALVVDRKSAAAGER